MIAALPPYWFTLTGKTQRRTMNYDSGGGPIVSYEDNLTGVGFRLNAHGGGEIGSEKMNTVGVSNIYAGGGLDIVATDRVIINSRVFDILNVNDPDTAGVYLKMDAREVSPSAETGPITWDEQFAYTAGALAGNDSWTATSGTALQVGTSGAYIAASSLGVGLCSQENIVPDSTKPFSFRTFFTIVPDVTNGIHYTATLKLKRASTSILTLDIVCNTTNSSLNQISSLFLTVGSTSSSTSGLACTFNASHEIRIEGVTDTANLYLDDVLILTTTGTAFTGACTCELTLNASTYGTTYLSRIQTYGSW